MAWSGNLLRQFADHDIGLRDWRYAGFFGRSVSERSGISYKSLEKLVGEIRIDILSGQENRWNTTSQGKLMPDRPIALYLPSLRGGGAERVMVTLADGFAERGHAVDLGARRVAASLPGLARRLASVPTRLVVSEHAHLSLSLDLFVQEDVVLPTPSVSATTLGEHLQYLIKNENLLKERLADRVPAYKQAIDSAIGAVAELIHG